MLTAPDIRKLRWRSEDGSAVVGHVLVQSLVVLVVIVLLQVAYASHVRAVALDAAAQGARRVALVGGTEAEGVARVKELVSTSRFASFRTTATVEYLPGPLAQGRQYQIVQMRVTMPLPLLGILGPQEALSVTGRCLRYRAGTS